MLFSHPRPLLNVAIAAAVVGVVICYFILCYNCCSRARARNISTHWFLSVEQSRWTKCFSNNIILKMNQQNSTVSKRYYPFYGLHTRVRDSRAFVCICMCTTWSCVTQFVRSKNLSIFPMNCVCLCLPYTFSLFVWAAGAQNKNQIRICYIASHRIWMCDPVIVFHFFSRFSNRNLNMSSWWTILVTHFDWKRARAHVHLALKLANHRDVVFNAV